MPNDCYHIFAERYRAASKELRAIVKTYWLKCHNAYLNSGMEDIICFTSRIVAQIAMIENEEQNAAPTKGDKNNDCSQNPHSDLSYGLRNERKIRGHAAELPRNPVPVLRLGR